MITQEEQTKREIEHEEKINIIWIEENILRDQKTRYYYELFESINKNCKEYKKFWFQASPTVYEAINKIKELEFEATIIIVSLNLYYDFFVEFYNNMNNIKIIPKIIIFSNTRKIVDQNKNVILNNPFFNYGEKIYTSIKKIKKLIKKEIKNKIIPNGKNINFKKDYFDEKLMFEYINNKEQLLLPMFYKVLIETKPTYSNQIFIEKLCNDYIIDKNNKKKEEKEKNDILINALKSIKSIKDIPIQLLSKYYARFYTYDSDFYTNLNTYLRNNGELEMSKYLPFIKTLYKGVDLKALPLVSQDEELYRGSQVSNYEIEEILSHENERKVSKLPTDIVFSKVFLSFSKDKNIAIRFLTNCILKENHCKVLFIVEKRKDINIEYSLDTHTDLKSLSFFDNEKEVLFFPFSSFGIKKTEETKINGEKTYIVYLDY